jgi:hypothetical protein
MKKKSPTIEKLKMGGNSSKFSEKSLSQLVGSDCPACYKRYLKKEIKDIKDVGVIEQYRHRENDCKIKHMYRCSKCKMSKIIGGCYDKLRVVV